jgi:hypothetical protein
MVDIEIVVGVFDDGHAIAAGLELANNLFEESGLAGAGIADEAHNGGLAHRLPP